MADRHKRIQLRRVHPRIHSKPWFPGLERKYLYPSYCQRTILCYESHLRHAAVFPAEPVAHLCWKRICLNCERYAAKINNDGSLVFRQTLKNLRTGNLNPFSR
jgi:hypothetical protein